jgi:hypothetical protein
LERCLAPIKETWHRAELVVDNSTPVIFIIPKLLAAVAAAAGRGVLIHVTL